MLTNILLGLILGIVITSFIILNNKINIIQDYLGTIIRKLDSSNSIITDIVTTNRHLKDRFDKQLSVINEYFEIINSSIDNKFKALNHNDDYIKDRQNTIHTITQNLIIEEHKATRKEIIKQAKISSKIKLKSKMNNNINKQ